MMSQPPARPQVFHITHGKNLARIIADACLLSDAEIIKRGGPEASIGIPDIKKRRLEDLPVSCHPGTRVGEYVPFYFCPRSVMLFILHKGNHPNLTYQGGQSPMLHLVADLSEVVAWADSERRPWAFTDRNAGSGYFQSFRDLAELSRLNWDHIASHNFGEALIKEAKQAEFLVYQFLPWSLVRTIGAINERVAARVRQIVSTAGHKPDVQVQPGWYY
jgi:hypothetical protein